MATIAAELSARLRAGYRAAGNCRTCAGYGNCEPADHYSAAQSAFDDAAVRRADGIDIPGIEAPGSLLLFADDSMAWQPDSGNGDPLPYVVKTRDREACLALLPPPVPDATDAAPIEATLLDTLRDNMNLLRELSLRYQVSVPTDEPDGETVISSPRDIYDLLKAEMEALAQEQLRALLLNVRNVVIGQRVIYQGTVNSSAVRPAEVFRPAVIENAPRIIIAHNHPSGDPTPSPEDVAVTRDIVQAGKLLDIEVMDHIVIGAGRFVSLKEKGQGF